MSYFHWIAGCTLGLAWLWRLVDAAFGVPKIADISRPEWDRKPPFRGGDVPSPTLMGYVADKRSLQAAFILPVIAMAISSAILFYGMRFAPVVRTQGDPGAAGVPAE